MRPDTNANTVVKSVMTQYAPGVAAGVKTASQRVVYTVSSDRGNGITVRQKEACFANPAPGKANCRERLVNMDQVQHARFS